MWHASIALFRNGQRVDAPAAGKKERRLAFALANDLLRGCGLEPSLEQIKGVAFHVRRSLRPDEIARLDPAWVALPAIDSGD